MDSSAGDLDRISALPDDLLHAILGFLGDAHAVTSTDVLSRRWRRVWVHAKNLSFTDRLEKYAVPGHFAVFVDWALAHAQIGDAGLDSLKICASRTGKGCTSPEQVSEWLRYAGRRVAGFIEVQLGVPTDRRNAVELPSHGRATSIRLILSKHRLRLPAAAAARYEALTELSLSSPVFVGSGNTLGDLVTSCCPRLRRLVLSEPRRLRQLVLRSETLEELEVTRALDLRTLDVTAPSLRVVRLTLSFHNPMLALHDCIEVAAALAAVNVARIAAPRLEEISMHCFSEAPPPELDIHDLASVRRLDKLWLDMHGKYCNLDVGLWLLESCPGVEHVDAWLFHYEEKPDAAVVVADDGVLVDLTAEGAPPFANVRSMELRAWRFPARDLVPSASSLLMRCPSLRTLCFNINDITRVPRKHKCFCESLTDKRKIHGKIGLEALEEVEITGFTGAREDMQLVTFLFESSKNSIRRMTLSGGTQIKPKTIPLKWNTAEQGEGDDDDDDTDTIDEQLMKIPITDRGCWHFAAEVFTWMISTQ